MSGTPGIRPIEPLGRPLAGRVVLRQGWHDLVFLHWKVDPAEIAPLLPAGVTPDIHDGGTWVGLIPFRMVDTAVFGAPPFPAFGSFVEVNVRLYGVDEHGRRGVVFRSLEASSLPAVLGARLGFGLPYNWAAAGARPGDDVLRYASRRHTPAAPRSLVGVRTTRTAPADTALAEFLTARWMLFQPGVRGTIARPNEHEPWELFDAELLDLVDELTPAGGIRSIGGRAPDSVLWSPGVHARFGTAGSVRLPRAGGRG